MSTTQQLENHTQSNLEHQTNHIHTSYRCYLRTPDMRAKIHTVSTALSVSELKQQVKTLLNLQSVSSPSVIKLVVNEVELNDQMNLAQHLFQNAIIHVLTPSQKSQEQSTTQQISIKLKQPPIDCPLFELRNVRVRENVKKLKQKIVEFYKAEHPENQIGRINENQLYLVYGGKILTDDKTLSDFDIDQNGIIYVVNGRVYSRQVTKEEADRRIQQIKNQKVQTNTQNLKRQEQHQNQSQIQIEEEENQVFNIVQNIVHDEDSDVEDETNNDLVRSHKIIRRYDSKSQKNPFYNQHTVDIDVQEVGQTPFVELQQESLLKTEQNQSQQNQQTENAPIDQGKHSQGEERNVLNQYLNQVHQKIITSQESLEGSFPKYASVEDHQPQSNAEQQLSGQKDDVVIM